MPPSKRIRQKLTLAVGATVGAALIGLISNVAGLDQAATSAIAGAALGLLVGFGTPYAFDMTHREASSKAVAPTSQREELVTVPTSTADHEHAAIGSRALSTLALYELRYANLIARYLDVGNATLEATNATMADRGGLFFAQYADEASSPIAVNYNWDAFLEAVGLEARTQAVEEDKPSEARVAKRFGLRPSLDRFVVPEQAPVRALQAL